MDGRATRAARNVNSTKTNSVLDRKPTARKTGLRPRDHGSEPGDMKNRVNTKMGRKTEFEDDFDYDDKGTYEPGVKFSRW